MKIIQICGTHGTGKTTVVNGILASSNFMRMESIVGGDLKEWWFDGDTAIIGKYGRNNCAGVDRSQYFGEQIYVHIEQILTGYAPKVLMFEDFRYGTSYVFKRRVRDIAENHGGKFCVIAFFMPLETAALRVIERTGNELVNIEAIATKQNSVLRSTKKIQADGVSAYFFDTSKLSPERLLQYVKRIAFG